MVPPSAQGIALCAASFYLRMFAACAGYHRYFSHRSFKTSRVFQFVLAFWAQTTLQQGALWWAAHHRHHHRHSDAADDIHSPVQGGFFWSHTGWFLSSRFIRRRDDLVRDWLRFPELRFLDDYDYLPAALFAAALYWYGGGAALYWGAVMSTVLLWHAMFLGNSACHLYGSRPYETRDNSRNNVWLVLLLLGENFHNNHHRYPSSARVGLRLRELDITYGALRVLSWFGIVWSLRQPPAQAAARISEVTCSDR